MIKTNEHSDNLLELRNVTKRYLRRTALDDVSLNIESGKTCLLLGPNGSGKTTMMKLIVGLARNQICACCLSIPPTHLIRA